ncbi:hypothetical protein XVE_2819 [Xanthomonas vesicatoria ATCC 35937]|uniref:Uncharacterized protein n=1 Tax=Xanthomonas vesicatoria ATCC 35937 TaxID=925775 RepID=F0BF39_9XANT|nr:hypothetical protein XVE_2819 [Xanthomonas vesicatoria ATCC 35937]
MSALCTTGIVEDIEVLDWLDRNHGGPDGLGKPHGGERLTGFRRNIPFWEKKAAAGKDDCYRDSNA